MASIICLFRRCLNPAVPSAEGRSSLPYPILPSSTSCSHSTTFSRPVDLTVGLLVNGDADAESALRDLAAGSPYNTHFWRTGLKSMTGSPAHEAMLISLDDPRISVYTAERSPFYPAATILPSSNEIAVIPCILQAISLTGEPQYNAISYTCSWPYDHKSSRRKGALRTVSKIQGYWWIEPA